MILPGIFLGLCAALSQALSYLVTRHYVQKRNGGSLQLLVLAHVWMGAISAALLPFIWPESHAPWRQIAGSLLQVAGFYLLGQIALIIALRYAEPSRISPLLAFKLVILAFMTLAIAGTPITPVQGLSIGLCLAGAFVLNYTGGSIHPRALIAIGIGCFLYSLSDWNIGRLVAVVGQMPKWQAFVWSTLLCYLLCGMTAAMLLRTFGSRRKIDWLESCPFAITWLAAMLSLFACFGLVGVLYGNILQSTRGIMSVVIGFALGRLGMVHLDQRTTKSVFVRRLIAAALMTVAVILYAWERDRLAF